MCIVFDVTQMSYQISVIYRAQTFNICKESFYRAHSVIEAVSVNRAHSVIEEKWQVVLTEFTRSPKEVGELSAYRVHSATEGFHRIICINRVQSVNTGIISWTVFSELGRPVKKFIEI